MPRITFRPDAECEAIIEKAKVVTGLNDSELCRVAIVEYVAKQSPDKIQRAHNAHRVRLMKRKAAA
jgi:hypothetical protein